MRRTRQRIPQPATPPGQPREEHPAIHPGIAAMDRPVLLAEHAHDLMADAGPCPVCGWDLRRGERIAQLRAGPHANQWAHTGCAGRT